MNRPSYKRSGVLLFAGTFTASLYGVIPRMAPSRFVGTRKPAPTTASQRNSRIAAHTPKRAMAVPTRHRWPWNSPSMGGGLVVQAQAQEGASLTNHAVTDIPTKRRSRTRCKLPVSSVPRGARLGAPRDPIPRAKDTRCAGWPLPIPRKKSIGHRSRRGEASVPKRRPRRGHGIR